MSASVGQNNLAFASGNASSAEQDSAQEESNGAAGDALNAARPAVSVGVNDQYRVYFYDPKLPVSSQEVILEYG
jgi:hypothetical protein